MTVKRHAVGAVLLGIAVVIVLGSLAVTSASAWYAHPNLSKVASTFANRNVRVVCMGTEEDPEKVLGTYAWGYTYIPTSKEKYTYIYEKLCAGALAIASNDPNVSDFYKAVGTATIVHEAYHLKRTRWNQNEAVTECRAMRHYDYALRMLGATDEQMKVLMPIMLIDSWRLRAWSEEDSHRSGPFGLTSPSYNRPGCDMPSRYDQYLGYPDRPE